MPKKKPKFIRRKCVVCGDDPALGCRVHWYGDLCHSCIEHLLDVAFNDYIEGIDEKLTLEEIYYIKHHD